MKDLLTEQINEAITNEGLQFSWEVVNGLNVPSAKIDLKPYTNRLDSITFSVSSSEATQTTTKPLQKTWPNQFKSEYQNKWFNADYFLDFYQSSPYARNGMPCAGVKEVPYRGYLVYGAIQKGNDWQPVTSTIFTQDLTIPETVFCQALAVLPEFRKLKLGSRIIEYSVLLFNHFKIAARVELNTNSNDSQVSGGWSPVPFWEQQAEQFGLMKNYGSGNSETGDGVYFYINLEDTAQRISQNNIWKDWSSVLNAK